MARYRLPKLAPKAKKPKEKPSDLPKPRSTKADARVACVCPECDCRCSMSSSVLAAGTRGCWLCAQGIHTTRTRQPELF